MSDWPIRKTLKLDLGHAKIEFHFRSDGSVALGITRNNKIVDGSVVVIPPAMVDEILSWLIHHGVGKELMDWPGVAYDMTRENDE